MKSPSIPKLLAAAAPTGPLIAALIGAAEPARAAAGDTIATSSTACGRFARNVPASTVTVVTGTGRTDDASR